MQFNPNELADVILNKTSSKNIDYNSFLAEGIFYNNMITQESEWSTFMKDGKEWNLNGYGFRSPQFKKNVDFLFAGCSITQGVGLDQEYLWHEQFISKIGGSYASVAFSGDSISGQILKIFSYIKKFGNPKNIICLFPNFDRFLMYNNKNLLASNIFFRDYKENIYNDMVLKEKNITKAMNYFYQLFKTSSDINDSSGRPSYFKTPLSSNDVITQELSHMYSAQMINMLSQYCDTAGIKFMWSTWDEPSAELIKYLKNDLYFKEYVDMDLMKWSKNFKIEIDEFEIDCHTDFKNHPDFNFASDRDKGIEHSHHGIHRHMHYAENFLNKFKEAY